MKESYTKVFNSYIRLWGSFLETKKKIYDSLLYVKYYLTKWGSDEMRRPAGTH